MSTAMAEVVVGRGGTGYVPKEVDDAAREVFQSVHSLDAAETKAVLGFRGGLAIGELVACLYARAFPASEWRTRYIDSLRHMSVQ